MELSRRSVLRGGATVTAGALAGCLGNSGGGGDQVENLPTPTIGDDGAPVTVQAFEDFSCPHCGTFALQVLPKIVSRYVEPGDVQYEHHDFPFVDPDWSWQAASAARAVQEGQGNEAFFEFAKGVYQNMDSKSIDVLGKLAERVEADREAVESAARDLTYKPVLESDKSLGKQKGVQGTPTVFVNDQKLENYAFETVSSAIDSTL